MADPDQIERILATIGRLEKAVEDLVEWRQPAQEERLTALHDVTCRDLDAVDEELDDVREEAKKLSKQVRSNTAAIAKLKKTCEHTLANALAAPGSHARDVEARARAERATRRRAYKA